MNVAASQVWVSHAALASQQAPASSGSVTHVPVAQYRVAGSALETCVSAVQVSVSQVALATQQVASSGSAAQASPAHLRVALSAWSTNVAASQVCSAHAALASQQAPASSGSVTHVA